MGALFRVLPVVGFVAMFWQWILIILAVAVAACLVWWGHKQSAAAVEQERRENAALVARADQQHAWTLAGDERGVYGEYLAHRTR
jgi:lipopolysaccharide export system protein LptC